MARNTNLMLETWIIKFIKVNYEVEKDSGHGLEVVAYHTGGQRETF